MYKVISSMPRQRIGLALFRFSTRTSYLAVNIGRHYSSNSFQLGPEQLEIQELVRRVAQEKVAPRAKDIDASAEYPQDMFDLLRELGLFTLPFPEEFGGQASLLSGVVAIEQLGVECYNTAYLLLVQWLPISAILAAGSPAQKAAMLPDLAVGKTRAAFSTTEPQSGSDIRGIKTKARPMQQNGKDGYVIDGAKIWYVQRLIADWQGARMHKWPTLSF